MSAYGKPATRLSRPVGGFSLIEVMVSMLLLAGGLLGVAYMQNMAMQYGQESYHRSQITATASELLDSMRAMQISTADTGASQYVATPSASDVATGCVQGLSTPTNDVVCFYEEIATILPYGTADISVNATDASYYDISVYWSDRGLTEQADFSDVDQSDSEINLNTKASCNSAVNRAWSDTLTWPFGNGPATDTCMLVHTWSIQVLNTAAL